VAEAVSTVQRVVLFSEDDPLRLACGRTLAPVEVAYATYGTLDADGGNAIFACHALTGDARVTGPGGWWSTLVGPGRPVDTDRFFVIGANLLGGCQGTTGPSSIDPATGEPYGMDFPPITVGDLVTVHRRLLEHLGVTRLYAALGGSLGGMQVLQWLIDAPGQIERAAIIAASAELTAENIAFSAVARAAIRATGDPWAGMAVARRLGHITYLSERKLQDRFCHRYREDAAALPADAASWLDTRFEVESYLDHQAETFLARFDPLSYLWMTRVMDDFTPFADPDAVRRALAAQPDLRALVLSFSSDWRFATRHSEVIADGLRVGGARHVTLAEVPTTQGHDAFLLESPEYHAHVRALLDG
jgi:homoserine O-acetyltransferase